MCFLPDSTGVLKLMPTSVTHRVPGNENRLRGVLKADFQVGEDAGAFDASKQSAAKWTFFTVELGVVLAIMYAVSLPSSPLIVALQSLGLSLGWFWPYCMRQSALECAPEKRKVKDSNPHTRID